MNKQTANIKIADVDKKIAAGEPLTDKELSVKTGYAYSIVRDWNWLPRLHGKTFWDDFVMARRFQTGLLPDPRIALRRRKSTAGISG